MGRITLEDYLKKNGSVQSGITAKSNLPYFRNTII